MSRCRSIWISGCLPHRSIVFLHHRRPLLLPICPRCKRVFIAPQADSFLLRPRFGLAVLRVIRWVLPFARDAAVVPRVAVFNLRAVDVLPAQRDGGDLALVAVGVVDGEPHRLLLNQLPQRVAAGDAVRLVQLGRVDVGKADTPFCAVRIGYAHRVAIVHAGYAGGVADGRLGAGGKRKQQREKGERVFHGFNRLSGAVKRKCRPIGCPSQRFNQYRAA